MYKNYFKRIFDIVIVLGVLFLIWPFMLIIILCLAVSQGWNGIFFVQPRPGKKGRVFQLLKFKTMTDKCDEKGKLLPDAQRLTKIGKFVRSISIDELPQLVNVLKGEMSLIGPRPLLVDYLSLYSDEQNRRHEVRPGITGWAQCHGRNSITWEQKFKYDVWYVDHCTLKVDLQIIGLTIRKVLIREGISQEGQATIEPFNGHN